MREIKFRGRIAQGIRNAGAWHYWGINGTDMLDAIDPDTIGQFTGLRDAIGVEIFEGDILESGRTSLNYQVVWLGSSSWSGENAAEFMALCTDPKKDFRSSAYAWDESKIIHNIHENPHQ